MDTSEFSESSDEEGVALAIGVLKGQTISECIHDETALKSRLLDVELFCSRNKSKEEEQFPESFRVSLEEDGGLARTDWNNDVLVERSFRHRATIGAKMGYRLCKQHGIKHVRPDDYFAEMLKPDKHMEKMRAQILEERQQLMERQQRKSAALSRVVAKEKERQATLRKQQERKRGLAEIEQWKESEGYGRAANRRPANGRLGRPSSGGVRREHRGTAPSRRPWHSGDDRHQSKRSGPDRAPKKVGRKRARKPNRPGKQRRQQMRQQKSA